jgi:plastocyanin
MKRTLPALALALLLIAAPAFADTATVTVSDSGFSPSAVTVRQGGSVLWQFDAGNHQNHEVKGSWFDSGPKGPGDSYNYTFFGAGKYTIVDALNPGSTMLVKVPTRVKPSSGPVGRKYYLTLASEPPQGFYWSLEYRYPDASGWTVLFRIRQGANYYFKPDHGPGTYQFRSQTHQFANDMAPDWSPPASIQVTPQAITLRLIVRHANEWCGLEGRLGSAQTGGRRSTPSSASRIVYRER